MLVLKLTYRRGAIIQTSDGPIRVCFCRGCNSRGAARVGFEAPANVKILREELVGREPAEETPGRG